MLTAFTHPSGIGRTTHTTSLASNRYWRWQAFTLASVAVLACLCAGAQSASGAERKDRLPAPMIQALEKGIPQEFYVEIDDASVREALRDLRETTGLTRREETEETISLRAERFDEIKEGVLGSFPDGEVTVLHRYEHLNLMYVRAQDKDVLDRFLSNAQVRMVYPAGRISPSLAQSLPMIEQGYPASLGYKGAGTVVAVIDTGVDYLRRNSSNQQYFGNCIQPPWYSGCMLVYALDCTTGADNCLVNDSPNPGGDSRYNHGTHVAATILGVAPESQIASLRVFESDTDSIFDTRLTQAVEQVVASKGSVNIVAVNMSLNYHGDGYSSTGSCDTAHPFAANLISQLTMADVVPVVSAGNASSSAEQAYAPTRMLSPACIQSALSVSSVIDHNDDPTPWSTLCDDVSGSKGKVSCWAMRSATTDLLAPGELITAADMTRRGTSMAAPHVSGAVAILRGKESLSQAQAQQRLIDAATPLYDNASGVWRRLLNVRNLLPPKAAQVLSQSVPATMAARRLYPVSVTLKNVGTETWTPNGSQCGSYRLGSANPYDNGTWVPATRVELPAPVAPGAQVTLNFTAIAPSAPGLYDFQWRMVHECVEWFGDFTPNVQVNVQTAPAKDAQIVSQNVPANMIHAGTYAVSIRLRNVGTQTWSPIGAQCNAYRLGSANPYNNGTWLPWARVDLPATVAPGGEVTLAFTVTAPSTPGSYNFQWRIVQECVEWLGDFTPNVVVTVSP